ncbi:MAG: sterol desaturase family protein [Candidatus Competibacter sp.]|nr:sterol desaturase family protein [Candidatus Competibacter sp.]
MEFDSLSSTAIVCTVVALLLLERGSPWRRTAVPIQRRWVTNLGLMLLGSIVVSAILPTSVLAVAAGVEGGWIRRWPPVLEAVVVFLLLDVWRYWEHRIFHEVPLLWRVHLVHHSDTSLDISTAERHHPLEAILATCTSLLLVFALGFSAQALAVYLVVAMLSALFAHANITLPERIDRLLRPWLVTPSVHAFHHSDYQPQTDSNYGTVLTVWDRLFGTYTDPAGARISHFGLAYFHRARDTTLAPVLLQPFEYHRGMSYPPRDDGRPAAAPAIPLSTAWRQALRQLLSGLALALVALWPTALSLTRVWANSEAYQYAWLVLPMFVYVVGWYHRDRILAMTPRPDFLGMVVILLALLLWCATYIVDIQLGQHIALVLVLQGIALSTLGRDVYRRLFPIMAMLFMLIPCGDVLQPLLRELTVKWIEWFALMMDLPHRIDGFMAYVGDHRYVVIDPCSGLTFVTLAGFLGYSFGVLLFRSFGKILALAALGAALGVFTNALRVWLIVGIDWLQGSQMDMNAHMDLQGLALLTALGLLFFLTTRLVRDGGREDSCKPEPTPGSGWTAARFAPLLSGLLVLLVIVPVQGLGARTGSAKTDEPLRKMAEYYPRSSWLGNPEKAGRALLIPYDDRLDIVLADPGGTLGRVDETLLNPVEQDIWRHVTTARYRDCSAGDCINFVHKTWRRKGSIDARHTLYVYYVGDMVTDSLLVYRLVNGWNRVTSSGEASGLIGFRVAGDLPSQHILAGVFRQFRDDLRSARQGVAPATVPPAGDASLTLSRGSFRVGDKSDDPLYTAVLSKA